MHQGKLNQALARNLHRVVLLLDRTTDDALRSRAGISLSQYAVLSNLGASEEPGISQQTIADYLGINKAAISRHIANLAQRGLLQRTRNPASGRENVLTITQEGAQTVVLARQVLGETMTPHFLVSGQADALTLLGILERMGDSLEQHQKGDV